MGTDSVISRETAWLSVAGDALPALPSSAGGPWQVIQGYWPRTPEVNKAGVYVLRAVLLDNRASNQRIRPQYQITLRGVWPVNLGGGAGTGLLETASQQLDNALDLLVQRIRGPVGDKSHGGRFLSAGENPRRVEGRFDDPEVTMAQRKALRVHVLYQIDDYEVSG